MNTTQNTRLDFMEKYKSMIRMKHYSKMTEKSYCYHLEKFWDFKNKIGIRNLSSQDINDYLVSLNSKDVSDSFFNQAINSIRFFFKYVINKKIKDYLVVRPKKAKTCPIILDYSEVQGMFNVCENKKHLAILSLLYSAGLRVSEVINLKISDIDSKQMIILIKSGKGRRDRLVPLDPNCLEILRNYFKEYRPKEYLFNGQLDVQYSTRSINEVLKQLAFKAGVNKRVYAHLIRHTKITHSLEGGNDIHTEQLISGHSNIKTTIGYTHKSPMFISNVRTPLSNINNLNLLNRVNTNNQKQILR